MFDVLIVASAATWLGVFVALLSKAWNDAYGDHLTDDPDVW